ncbi:hypothetical protein EDEG_01436 [Edhazardia aedis USNM 41457]|uniref:Small ribosomal subunit protein uS4 N-terminal domain-containing protein n=1 Tax=Edhazardia aedis (strain USNM 41457) TaxID=1003232 RepID=J9DSK6_EDHAE|nr:hypothetical protein EDEG_01436 [Edhazardia aedis USNM 41457]|eukprot:EJW04312.1 hypothetical protein EDEG_01436 [Edhazardia aedis USNM 41457]
MRKLRFHEQKLLRKVDFNLYKSTNTVREQQITARFYLQNRDTYHFYNCIVGKIRKLAFALSKLKDTDEVKNSLGKNIVNRLFAMGLIKEKKLIACSKISVSAFCSRRLPTVMIRNKMVENMKAANLFVEHGHVSIGNKVITDCNTIVSKGMEDFIKWRDGSKILKKIEVFNENHDDFDEYA